MSKNNLKVIISGKLFAELLSVNFIRESLNTQSVCDYSEINSD